MNLEQFKSEIIPLREKLIAFARKMLENLSDDDNDILSSQIEMLDSFDE